MGRRAARFFSFQWEGVESLSSSPTLQSVLLPIYAWFAKLIGGVERIEAPSDLGEIEVFLERKRSSNAIISSTLEEVTDPRKTQHEAVHPGSARRLHGKFGRCTRGQSHARHSGWVYAWAE